MTVSEETKRLIVGGMPPVTQGENNAHAERIETPADFGGWDLRSLTFVLRATFPEYDAVAEQVLEKTVLEGRIVTVWRITSEFTAYAGRMELELRLFRAEGGDAPVIKFPGDRPLLVRRSEDHSDAVPPTLAESLLLQMETALGDSQASAGAAKASAEEALASEQAAKKAAADAGQSKEDAQAAREEAGGHRDTAAASSQAAQAALAATETLRDEAQAIKESTQVEFDVQGDRVGFKRADAEAFTYTAPLTGPKGDAGEAASVAVGGVTTGEPGTAAAVVNSGDAHDAVLNFTIPSGKDGRGLEIKGIYAALADLQAAHPTGSPGDIYAVGTSEKNTAYLWDAAKSEWADMGPVIGAPGKDGLSAYAYAVAGGYAGTEEEFAEEFGGAMAKLETLLAGGAVERVAFTADDSRWSGEDGAYVLTLESRHYPSGGVWREKADGYESVLAGVSVGDSVVIVDSLDKFAGMVLVNRGLPDAYDAKAEKAPHPTEGHLAALDAQGNPVDSGKGAGDFLDKDGEAKDAAMLGNTPAERYLADYYSERSGAKSYTFPSFPGRMARPSCEGYTRIAKPNPDAEISPDNVAELTPARLALTDGTTARSLNTDLWSLPGGAADSYDGRTLTRRVGKLVLDGSEEWGDSYLNPGNTYQSNMFFCNSVKNLFRIPDADYKPAYACSHFTFATGNEIMTRAVYAITELHTNAHELRITAPKDSALFKTADELKAWLAANPVTILYELPETVSSYANLDIPLSAQNTITCTDAVLPSFGLREIDGPERRVAWARDLCRPNLLINGDFRRGCVVNQRGQAEYTGTTYTVDCWRSSNATGMVTVGESFVTLRRNPSLPTDTRNSFFRQGIEKPERLIGKTLTLSCLVRGSAGVIRLEWLGTPLPSSPYIGEAKIAAHDDWQLVTTTFTLEDPNASLDALGIWVTIRLDHVNGVDEHIDIRCVKLDTGDRFTGWIETNPQQELAKCQRYGFATEGFQRFRAVRLSANSIDFMVPCPVPLRAIPTLPQGLGVANLAGAAITGFALSIVCVRSAIMVIRATKTNHGLPDAMLQAPADSVLLFDANL